MKKLILALAIFAGSNAYAQQNPFSGSWTQTSREHISGKEYVNAMPVTLTLSPGKDKLTAVKITLIGDSLNHESAVTEELDLKGKITKTLTPSKKNKIVRLKAFTKNSFTESATYSVPDQPDKIQYSLNEDWTLAEDGETLTITRTYDSVTDPGENRVDKATYTRKK